MHYARRRANLAWSDHGVKSYSYRFDVQVHGNSLIGSTHFHEVGIYLSLQLFGLMRRELTTNKGGVRLQ